MGLAASFVISVDISGTIVRVLGDDRLFCSGFLPQVVVMTTMETDTCEAAAQQHPSREMFTRTFFLSNNAPALQTALNTLRFYSICFPPKYNPQILHIFFFFIIRFRGTANSFCIAEGLCNTEAESREITLLCTKKV
jgi:hypothetical protein